MIHIGVGSLSGIMAILLFAYAQKRPSKHLYPLILLFVLWAAVAVISVLVIVVPGFAPLGEPVVSYIVGSILSLVLLLFAIKYTPVESDDEASPSTAWFSLGILILFSLVAIGEIANQVVLQQFSWLAGNPMSSILLLSTNLFVIYGIAYLLFVQTQLSHGKLSIESYVVLFLSMWIVPNILKSYYPSWTYAWWASEILIFIGLLLGPALMGILYVRAMSEAEGSHSKASLYADLLMHDISNYHQMLLTSVELLSNDEASSSQRDRLSTDAYHVISLAEQLITNVRLITESEDFSHESFEPINLMDTLVGALDRVMRVAGGKGVKLQLMPFSARAYVLGSDILKHVFINIIHSVLLQPIAEQRVIIEINPISEMGSDYWQVRLFIPNWWAEEEDSTRALPRTEEDFSGSALGILVSRLVTESLGGRLMAIKRLEEPDMGTYFLVMLPAYQKVD
ncbi:MAG: hypothetical protein ACFFD6_08270 [Candidatus Thorarchaeota archaeon]